MGKEAASLRATGTMANQIALHCTSPGPGTWWRRRRAPRHERRGDDGGGARRDRVPDDRPGSDAAGSLPSRRPTAPRGGRVLRRRAWSTCCRVENTHQVAPADASCRSTSSAPSARSPHDAGVPVYLDGARIFNAAAACGDRRDRDRRRSRRPDVLSVEGTGGADRVGPVRAGRVHAREARRLKILYRRGVAAGRDRRRGRPDRSGGGPEAPARGPRNGPAAWRRASPRRSPGSWTRPVETNMVFVDTEAVGHGDARCDRAAGFPRGRRDHSGGKIRMVTHLDVDDAGRRGRARRMAQPRGRSGEEGRDRLMALFSKNYPPEIARAHPAGAATGEGLAGPALRADPDVRRPELGLRGHRAGREPRHALLRRSSRRLAERRRAGRHALRDRLDDARQHVGRGARSGRLRSGRSRRPKRSG